MNFGEALVLLKQGKKIRRKGWTEYHCLSLEETNRIPSLESILADDWEEYVEPVTKEDCLKHIDDMLESMCRRDVYKENLRDLRQYIERSGS